MDLTPGNIVEIDGEPHLLETVDVQIKLVAQRIHPALPIYDHNREVGFDPDKVRHFNPVFVTLEGSIDDPQFQSPRLRVLTAGDPHDRS